MSTALQPPRAIPSFSTTLSFPNTRSTTWTFPEQSFNLNTPHTSHLNAFPRDLRPDNCLRLPGLAALASAASQYQHIVEADRNPSSILRGEEKNSKFAAELHRERLFDRPDSHPGILAGKMSYATVAPGQSSSNTPPVCNTCHTSNTPLWRRDENGNVLCNACGLFLKLHGRDRPISLKTNVVKSRKRVKATGPPGQQGPQQKKKKPSSVDPSSVNGSSSQQQGLPEGYQNAQSSAQQSDTPNIAPQHMFDSITLDAANQQSLANLYNSGYAPQRNASPSASSLLNGIAGSQNGHLDVPQTSTELVASNNHLKTRVSELEVINNLFRERVAELENGESETKRALEEALTRINELEAKVSELEGTASKTTPEGDVQDASKSRLSQATE